jgi:hypothetical protein
MSEQTAPGRPPVLQEHSRQQRTRRRLREGVEFFRMLRVHEVTGMRLSSLTVWMARA